MIIKNFYISTVSKTIAGIVLTVVISALISGCGGPDHLIIPKPAPYDMHNVQEPAYREINYLGDGFEKQVIDEIADIFDIHGHYRNIANNPKQAKNLNAFDEVENSSWFTNRNAFKQMTVEEIARGPDTGPGPDAENIWTITRAKNQGVTPGFNIEDSRGDIYVIKFDPTGYSELMSGAEVVSTKLFYAAGYNVPENYITEFDPDILRVGEGVKFTDENGDNRTMAESDLEAILNKIEKKSNGKIRAIASKFISGKPLGPFKYSSVRKDDFNDVIPHQHRRELRAVRVLGAWLNHSDAKAGNSHDTYVTENGRSYVKHYLLDFGSTLGSAAHGPTSVYRGHENSVDPERIIQYTVSLGLHIRPYEKIDGFPYKSIGLYDSELFDPHKYRFNHPIPAFKRLTWRDGYWGAKIVMSFTDDQIKAAVSQGKYSNPDAAEYLYNKIRERRDIIGRFYFGKVNPLDKFEVRKNSNGGYILSFADLAVETGLEPDNSIYHYDIILEKQDENINSGELNNAFTIPLPAPSSDNIVLKIRTQRSSDSGLSKWVKVYLKPGLSGGGFTVYGILRQE